MKLTRICDVLDYEQPSKYIVKSEQYADEYRIPVLTAGKSFILGYTDETEGIYNATKDNPIILFDDFTTDCRYIDFSFKVKSSAVKILKLKRNDNNLKYLYYTLKNIVYDTSSHKRYWISQYSKFEIKLPSIEIQNKIVKEMEKIEELIENKEKQIKKFNELVNAQFIEMFIKNEFPKEKLANNVQEMFIGPFGSALKNECFVDKSKGYCVVYEQKHAIYKNIDDFRWITKDKYNTLKRFNIQAGDIIVSCRGTIGKTYVIPENAPLGIMHPSIMKIRLKKEKYLPEFFEAVLKHYLYEKENQTNGATIKMGIKASILEKEEFIIPKMQLQIEYLNLAEKIDKQKEICNKVINKLIELKKSKMQEYFGGVINE